MIVSPFCRLPLQISHYFLQVILRSLIYLLMICVINIDFLDKHFIVQDSSFHSYKDKVNVERRKTDKFYCHTTLSAMCVFMTIETRNNNDCVKASF